MSLHRPRYIAALVVGLLICSPALARDAADVPGRNAISATLPTAMTVPVQRLNQVDLIEAPIVNLEDIRLEDEVRDMEGLPPRYAVPQPVLITPDTDGTWEQLDNGMLLWRLQVGSPNALSLNLGFGRYHMPDGGRLFVYSADQKQIVRAFTAADNEDHGELWTPVVASNKIVVEVTLPEAVADELELELTSINPGYRFFGEKDGGLRSGSCNVDVVCPEGDNWRSEIASVAVISTGGSTFCTGFMVNNAAQDLTPYFMTAEHCGITSSNAASLVAYWNYENSTCRPPGSAASGGPGDGTLNQFNTGSFFRATYDPSDFTLVELDDDPDPAFEVAFAGWDNSGNDATSAVAIHHPNTDEKRISFEYQPTTITSYLGEPVPGDGTHVRIEDWDLGTTEPGSSGSPLFDQNHRVIGQLHGGYASCTSQTSDWYGAFAVSWTGGGTAASRLSNWLDPGNTGATFVNTIDGRGLGVQPGQGVTHFGVVGGPFTDPVIVYTLSNPSPTAVNYSVSLTSSFGLLLDGQKFPITGTLPAGGGSTTVTVSLGPDIDNLPAGMYVEDILFEDLTNVRTLTRTHVVEIGQTLISVTPELGLEAGGPVGGPFFGSQTYRVTSERPSPVTVEIAPSDPWISVDGGNSPVQIVLNGTGDFADVTVGYYGPEANNLQAGLYSGSVSFTNLVHGAGDAVRDVLLDVGRYVYPATDVPQSINDNSTITSTIQVSDVYCIGDVDVEVDISHTYIGDLIVELRSPQGTVVRLHNRSGGTEEDIVTTYDDGSNPPEGPGLLADFNGESPQGDWVLTISDNAGQDVGSLNAWALRIATSGAVCPPAAFDDEVTMQQYTTADITLSASSTSGNPMSYVIESLPAHGLLTDPNGGSINAAPYTLLSNGNVVRFTPVPIGYAGNDSFTFSADDGQPSNIATISVTVGGPQLVYEWNMDSDPGWSTTGDWAFGRPIGVDGDPSAGHTGVNVYGYNLSGKYANDMPERYLTTRAIDCSTLSNVEVKFWRWLGVEHATYDHARFQASNNGTSWTTVWENLSGFSNTMNETSWTQQSYDISAIADGQSTVYLRWVMGTTDGSVTYHGWNVDDVEIWAIAPSGGCNSLSACPSADVNCDNVVSGLDLAIIQNSANFGLPAQAAAEPRADVNGDGVVSGLDVAAASSSSCFGL